MARARGTISSRAFEISACGFRPRLSIHFSTSTRRKISQSLKRSCPSSYPPLEGGSKLHAPAQEKSRRRDHAAGRRKYVITMSGHAELVMSGGQTIQVGPGSIELAEDLAGKGHITRTVGNEDRIAIVIPVTDGK